MTTAERAIAKARQYIGVKESPSGSNKTQFGAWYGMNGQPWCAIFQSFVASEIGVRFQGATTAKGFAYCPYIVAWAKRERRWLGRGGAEPGDWVLFDWNGDGVADHVELVVSAAAGRVTSVGGNTGPQSVSNGGQVLEHSHSESNVLGYMRPPYGHAPPDSPPPSNNSNFYPRRLEATRPYPTGDDVRRVQKRLRALGFVPLAVDGIYGPESAARVRDFQASVRIVVDGVFGPVTASHLDA